MLSVLAGASGLLEVVDSRVLERLPSEWSRRFFTGVESSMVFPADLLVVVGAEKAKGGCFNGQMRGEGERRGTRHSRLESSGVVVRWARFVVVVEEEEGTAKSLPQPGVERLGGRLTPWRPRCWGWRPRCCFWAVERRGLEWRSPPPSDTVSISTGRLASRPARFSVEQEGERRTPLIALKKKQKKI